MRTPKKRWYDSENPDQFGSALPQSQIQPQKAMLGKWIDELDPASKDDWNKSKLQRKVNR